MREHRGIGDAWETLQRLTNERGAVRRRDLRREGLSGAWVDHLRGIAVERIGPGLYGAPTMHVPLVVRASIRVPSGVLSLASAMAIHGVSPGESSEVWMTIPARGHRPGALTSLVHFIHARPRLFALDVETKQVEGFAVRVYSLQRTFIDCVRHRARLGEKWVLDTWRPLLRRLGWSPASLEDFARERHAFAPVRSVLRALCPSGSRKARRVEMNSLPPG